MVLAFAAERMRPDRNGACGSNGGNHFLGGKTDVTVLTSVEKTADHVVGILRKPSRNENARNMRLSDLGQGKEPRKLGLREENAVSLFQMAFAVFKISSAQSFALFHEGENMRILRRKAVREDMAGVSRIQTRKFYTRDRVRASFCRLQKLGDPTNGIVVGEGKGGYAVGDQLFDERGNAVAAVGAAAV